MCKCLRMLNFREQPYVVRYLTQHCSLSNAFAMRCGAQNGCTFMYFKKYLSDWTSNRELLSAYYASCKLQKTKST